MKKIIPVLFSCILVLLACTKDKMADLKPLNLLQYGMPLTIMAPDSADIKKENWVSQQGISVKKGKDYSIQVWSADASTTDIATIKAAKIAELKEERFFSRIVTEDPDGFIFENKIDSMTMYYGFRQFSVQGDKEFIIQNGLAGNFSLDQAELMYQAVKPKK